MLTAQEIYTAARSLSLPERLRLAALILDELDLPAASPIDMPQFDLSSLARYNDAWTEEDISDFRQFSASHLNLIEATPGMEQDDALPPLEDLWKMRMEQSLEPEPI
jgi:hypothetical protein